VNGTAQSYATVGWVHPGSRPVGARNRLCRNGGPGCPQSYGLHRPGGGHLENVATVETNATEEARMDPATVISIIAILIVAAIALRVFGSDS
jgi:hypothetical protein